MTGPSCDVAIVGGGPAGCATALSLRTHAPALSVVLIEASGYESPRIGETLPPPARRILQHLEVWDAFCAQGHREVQGTTAAWSDATPQDNDFIFALHGAGWHLDRRAFDAMLAEQAEGHGARRLRGARVTSATRTAGAWCLDVAGGGELCARFLVDATGRQALLARRAAARVAPADRLVGFARFFRQPPGADPRTLVEAFEEGWWYTAGLPDGLCVAACMTDVDLARRLRLREPSQWTRLFQSTIHVGERLRGASPDGPLVVRAAESRRLDPPVGDDWIAVGDAASVFDPLSSQGILKALRSGTFASYAIADRLVRADDSGLRRYRDHVRAEFESYLVARERYYGEERRWPASEFWNRRVPSTAAAPRPWLAAGVICT